MIKKALMFCLLAARDTLAPLLDFQEVAMLCYHSISDADVPTALRVQEFEKQLTYLKKCGYAFVSLDAVLDWLEGESLPRRRRGELPKKAIALTFDDGYTDFETAALPILEKFAAPVALFSMGDPEHSRAALGNDISLLTPEALERIRSHPLVTLGYHSMTHANLSKLSGDDLAREMTPFNLVQGKSSYFAYPGGNYSPEAVALARELGYRAAFSIKRHLIVKGGNPYLLPRSVVTRDMSLRTVRFHTTRALEWYRRIVNTVS